MHGTIPAQPRQPRRPALPLVLRLALRELRGGLKGFGVFLACIALGVAAIAGVSSISRSLTEGLGREGRKILGGDVTFSLIHREAGDAERAFLAAQGRVSSIATMRAMAIAGDKGSGLVELKAVDAAYPTVGDLVTEPAAPAGDLLAERDGAFGAIADPALLIRLDLKAGDRVSVGAATFAIRASLVSEPDKIASGVGFGPRFLVSQAALRATGLLQPGSLVRWTYRLERPAASSDADLERDAAAANKPFPEAGWEIRSRVNADPADEERGQADEGQELRETLDVAGKARIGVDPRADLPPGLREGLVGSRGDALEVGVARSRRALKPVGPAHEAHRLQEPGGAQGRLRDQQARPEADAARDLVRFGDEARADREGRGADADAVAGLEIEPDQQRRVDDGAERAVAQGEKVAGGRC